MVIDRIIKVAQFMPTMKTLGVAKLFVEEKFVNYGLPREIICDKDRKFGSGF